MSMDERLPLPGREWTDGGPGQDSFARESAGVALTSPQQRHNLRVAIADLARSMEAMEFGLRKLMAHYRPALAVSRVSLRLL